MSVWMLCVCVFMRFMSTNKVISNRTKLPFLKYFSIILSTFPTYTSAISSSSSPLFFLFHSFDTITMHMNPYSLLEMKLYNAPNYRKKPRQNKPLSGLVSKLRLCFHQSLASFDVDWPGTTRIKTVILCVHTSTHMNVWIHVWAALFFFY